MKIERLARKGILKIASYVPGKSIEEVQKEFGAKRWVKLASNENLLGPSPRAVAAIRDELPHIHLYPEGPCTILRKAMAKKFAIPEERIVISNGADNLILMIANVFICNPNNPTGTTVSLESFNTFLSKLPKRVIVVLDEAYGDFVEDAFYPNGLDYLKAKNPMMILRTFSKVYGLAGVRGGSGLGRAGLLHCLCQAA